jgi:hypothetical protein
MKPDAWWLKEPVRRLLARITEAAIKNQILGLITIQTFSNGFMLSVLKNHMI